MNKKINKVASDTHSSETQEVTYSCDQCEFKTNKKEQIDLHTTLKHTSANNKYSWEQCEYQLDNETELSIHIEVFHNLDPEIIRSAAIEIYGSDEELNLEFAKENICFSKLETVYSFTWH